MNRFLLDEHLPGWWPRAIVLRTSELQVWHCGDPGAPGLGALDPQILEWCEAQQFYLLTNNRGTMPTHLANHSAAGRHVPGIFMVKPDFSIEQLVEELMLIDAASLPDEHQDQIQFLPLT
jgi:hypothetical protein